MSKKVEKDKIEEVKIMVEPDIRDWLVVEKVKRRKKTIRETLREILEESGADIPSLYYDNEK